jgi:DNA ligase 1
MKNPDAPQSKGSKKKPTSKANSKTPSKRKKTNQDDDEGGDEEEGDGDTRPGKRAKKPMSTRGKGKEEDGDDGDDDDDEDLPISKKVVPELLLANKWDIENGPDPSGWWISEKLDGVRFAGHFQLPPTFLCNFSAQILL